MVCLQHMLFLFFVIFVNCPQLRAIKNLVDGAQSGDRFFFHCTQPYLILPADFSLTELKMQDILFKLKIHVTARRTEWMSVRQSCYLLPVMNPDLDYRYHPKRWRSKPDKRQRMSPRRACRPVSNDFRSGATSASC